MALDVGFRFGRTVDRDRGMLVVLRAGHGFSLGASRGTDLTPAAISSLSIDPFIGVIAPTSKDDAQNGAAIFGLAVSFRWDTFSERKFGHL